MTITVKRIHTLTLNQIFAMPIIVFFIFFAFFSPLTRSFGNIRYFFAILLMIVTFNNKSIARIIPIFIFSSVVLLMLVLSGRFSERGFNAPISHETHFTALFMVSVIAEYLKKSDDEIKRFIIRFTLLLLTISTLVSIYYVLRVNQYAIRFNEAYGFTRVLRFSQTYSICMICMPMFLYLIYTHNNKTKLLGSRMIICALLILFICCIVVSLFATAVFLLSMGFLIIWSSRIYKSNRIAFLLLVMLIVLFFIVVCIIPDQFAEFIYRNTEDINWIIKLRIRGITDLVFGTDLSPEYSMERRTELASYSLNTFKEHPILGIGYNEFGYGVIGMHQEWLDMLGTFGLFGTIMFAVVFIPFLMGIYKQCPNQLDRNSYIVCLCMFFVLGFLNPCLSFQVLFVILCVAPNISSLLKTDRRNAI